MESTITNFRDWYAPNFEKFQRPDKSAPSCANLMFIGKVIRLAEGSTINMRGNIEEVCGAYNAKLPIIVPQILGPVRIFVGIGYALFDIVILIISIFLRIVPNKSEETTTSLSEITKRSVEYLRHDGANIGKGVLEFIPFVVLFLPSERMGYTPLDGY